MRTPPEINYEKSLRDELEHSQAREEATRKILDLLARSREDRTPVFDAICENATRLCNAPIAGLILVDNDRKKYQLAASRGTAAAFVDEMRKNPPDFDPERFVAARAMVEKRAIHVEDLASQALYGSQASHRVVATQTEGIRTALFVPLIWEDQSIGAIGVWRREVKPFQPGEIALVETFAAQAVIAIENVRQFREVQTRLEREAATSEVLSIISQSRDDELPVFDAILDNALRLCGSTTATLFLVNRDQETLYEAAARGHVPEEIQRFTLENPPRLDDKSSSFVQAFEQRKPVQILDAADTPRATGGPSQRQLAVEKMGIRTILQVPLMQQNQPIGLLSIYRTEVHAYNENEIALLKTFAAQAVIAIENVQQFKALETLNAELGERVKEQVGEIERMGKLKRFLPSAVADAVVSSGSEKMLSSHRALLGVLFCDIRGFTAFCETAEPEETIEVLQTYHEEMGKLINDHAAGVDHRMGDGIMVLFNDPLPCEDPAGDAVKLAIAMRARMSELCRAWKRMGYRLGFGVGISLGYATVGMVGFEGRSDYTASGTAVNLASRLCDEAEDGQILLSTRAAIAVEDVFSSISVGEISLKGIREPVEVFRLDSA